MTYILKIKQRALELLQEGYSPEIAADKISKEYNNEPKTPTGKTIRIWGDEVRKLEKELAKSKQTVEEFIRTHPAPKWLRNLYLVKIENGEIKFL